MDKLAEKLSEVVLIIIPLSIGYFGGIIYLSAYLSSYSINIHEVDLSVQLVLTYSYKVFYSLPFVLVVVVLLVAYFAIQIKFAKKQREWLIKVFESTLNLTIAALVSCFLIFLLIYHCAQWSADRAAELLWKGDTARVFFNQLPESWELSLGVRQRMTYENCVARNDFRHIISTATVTYALCVVGDGGTEGLVIGQRHEDGRLLPIRDIRHENS